MTTTSQQSRVGTGSFTLLLFASASTFAGNIETLTLPAPTTLRSLFANLEAQFPGITAKVLRSSAVTVNLEYVDFDPEDLDGDNVGKANGGGREVNESTREDEGLDLLIHPGDEVGIIPPTQDIEETFLSIFAKAE